MTTLKCVSAWRLGQELDGGGFSLFEEPAVLLGCEHQTMSSAGRIPINLEAMIVVGGIDLELNFRPQLHMNGRA